MSALGGYSRAAALDPGWEEPPEREKQLLEYLKKVTELIQNKVGKKALHILTIPATVCDIWFASLLTAEKLLKHTVISNFQRVSSFSRFYFIIEGEM